MQRAITCSLFCGVELTKIIPFKQSHLECMDMREHEQKLIKDKDLTMLESAIAFTGMVDGRIICCGGVVPLNNGSAEIWLIPSVYVSHVTMTFARELRKTLFSVREDLGVTRLQTACINDDLHDRWMTFLGFQKEGVMRKYHNGEDYSMWGRVWE